MRDTLNNKQLENYNNHSAFDLPSSNATAVRCRIKYTSRHDQLDTPDLLKCVSVSQVHKPPDPKTMK